MRRASSDDLSCRRPCAHMSAEKSTWRSEHAMRMQNGTWMFFTRPQVQLYRCFSAASYCDGQHELRSSSEWLHHLELPSSGTVQVLPAKVHVRILVWLTHPPASGSYRAKSVRIHHSSALGFGLSKSSPSYPMAGQRPSWSCSQGFWRRWTPESS